MHEDADPVAAWIVVAVLVLSATLASGLRVTTADERLVIRGPGRATRVRGPGVTFVVPGLQRATRVSLRPCRLGPVWVTARTADAVTAYIAVAAQMQIVDPSLATKGNPECRAATTLENAVSAEVARVGVATLADRLDVLRRAVAERCETAIAGSGTQLACVDVMEIRLDLDAHLLDWAARRAGARGRC